MVRKNKSYRWVMFFIANHSWLQLMKSVLICCVCLRCLRVASEKGITQVLVAVWAPLLGVELGGGQGRIKWPLL